MCDILSVLVNGPAATDEAGTAGRGASRQLQAALLDLPKDSCWCRRRTAFHCQLLSSREIFSRTVLHRHPTDRLVLGKRWHAMSSRLGVCTIGQTGSSRDADMASCLSQLWCHRDAPGSAHCLWCGLTYKLRGKPMLSSSSCCGGVRSSGQGCLAASVEG